LFAKIELKILYIKNLPNNFQIYKGNLSVLSLTELSRGLMPVAYNKLIADLDLKFEKISEQPGHADDMLNCFTSVLEVYDESRK